MAKTDKEGLILKALRGSITYGTNITNRMARKYRLNPSDRDEVSIIIPPKTHVIGTHKFKSYEYKNDNAEGIVYSLKHYLHLASQCNPNILETMFLEPNHYITLTPVARKLIENRDLFLTKRAKHTYSGYAYSQIQRMKTKRENATGRTYLVEKFGYDTKFAKVA